MQSEAAIIQGKNIIGISLQGRVYLMNRRRVIAALMKNDTKQVQAVKMIGLRCKNLITNLFRICQSTSLMQCHSFGKQ